MQQEYCLEAYASNVKGMYTSAPGHMIDCTEFMLGVYTDIVVSYLCMKQLGYVPFLWHLKGIFVVGTYMVIAW